MKKTDLAVAAPHVLPLHRRYIHVTDSARLKKLAREYMAAHPGTRYQQALDAVRAHQTQPGTDAWLDFIAAADTGDGCLFNIGTGVESSVNDLYSTMASTIGGPSEPGRAPARHGELERSALDPGHAAQVLGWRPTTDLAEGVRRTIDWFRQSGR